MNVCYNRVSTLLYVRVYELRVTSYELELIRVRRELRVGRLKLKLSVTESVKTVCITVY